MNMAAHHLVRGHAWNFLISSGVKTSLAWAKVILASAQTLVPTFSFPLLPVLRFFTRGVASLMETPGEAARPSSRVGVDEPFSAEPQYAELEKGRCWLDLVIKSHSTTLIGLIAQIKS